MKRLSVWLFALSLVMPLLHVGQAIAQVRIMPVGDSITQGFGNVCSYRRPLSQALIANACSVDFVGSRMTAGGSASSTTPNAVCAAQNTDHQAVSGDRADQILNNARYNFTNELNNRQPDVVLLHIGSNDIFGNQSVASTVNDINDIIDEVFEQRPGATVVVADVIPWSEESPTNLSGFSRDNLDMLALSAELSAAITSLVNNRVSSGEAVVLAEVKDGFDNDLMTTDGVHPNPIGEAHIANRMLEALYGLGVCGSNPTDVQPPITYISVPSEGGEQLSASPTLSGTALDQGGAGIDRVRIAIEELDNNSEPREPRLWLNYAEGTFSSAFDSSIVANIPSAGTNSTSWSITTGLTSGNYRLFALALDGNENQVYEAAGNGEPARNAKVWTSRVFEVGIGGPREPPGPPAAPPAITNLAEGATLDPGSMTFTWDDNGTNVAEWWLYAGNTRTGRGQFLYDRGQSLSAASRSGVVTDLPGDGSTVFITLWYRIEDVGWKAVITEYKADASGAGIPKITSPTDGGTFDSIAETFSWTANGSDADKYWLYAGTGEDNDDYYNSGPLTGTSDTVTGLPTNGETVYIRLWHQADGGRWRFVDSTYVATTIPTPAITNLVNGSTISTSQIFNWTANGTDVAEWWLYAGENPGSASIYNSGSLGTATSHTISGLPRGTVVHITLWFRPSRGDWQRTRYSYTVQ